MMRLTVTALFSLFAFTAAAEETPRYGPELEGFDYPYPVRQYSLDSQGQKLRMAYMDIAPSAPNGRTIVLLHGKNFCGATWEGEIAALSKAGYRVIAPDQIGFCKSSKPEHYQYSFQQLAANTKGLLESLKAEKVTVLGHSTGGMLAVRFGLMYPEATEQLVLVNPIGLEDWKVKGVPYQSIDKWYERELKATAESMRKYQQATYYAGAWKPEYDRWVLMLAGLFNGEGRKLVAWNSALQYDMIYTQPVLYEFGALKMPVALIIGEKDNTAIGKDLVPPEIREKLGNYPALAEEAAAAIPKATLVTFPNLGHAPQIQSPAEFQQALLDSLKSLEK